MEMCAWLKEAGWLRGQGMGLAGHMDWRPGVGGACRQVGRGGWVRRARVNALSWRVVYNTRQPMLTGVDAHGCLHRRDILQGAQEGHRVRLGKARAAARCIDATDRAKRGPG